MPDIPQPSTLQTAYDALRPEQRHVLGALALGAVPRTRSWVHGWLGYVPQTDASGRRYTQEQVKTTLASLAQDGWLSEDPRRPGYWTLATARHGVAWLDLLAHRTPAELRHSLALADDHGRAGVYAGHRWPSLEAAIARLRLEALLGQTLTELEAHKPLLPWGLEWERAVELAVFGAIDALLLPRLHCSLRVMVLADALVQLNGAWVAPAALDAAPLTADLLAQDTSPDTFGLRAMYAEYLVLSGPPAAQVHEVLAPLAASDSPGWQVAAQSMASMVPAVNGQWAEAEAAFDAAQAVMRKLTGKRRGLVPTTVGTWYVLALLALGTPAHLQKALKFCLAEGGKREPVLESPFGHIALAIQMRIGEAPRDAQRFRPYSHGGHVSTLDWWRWLMRAWLKEGSQPEPLLPAEMEAAKRLQARLSAAGLLGLRHQLDAALQVLRGEGPPPGFFIVGTQEGWQVKLDALRAVAEPQAAAAPTAKKGPTESRVLWLLDIEANGRVAGLVPQEQTLGTRGWNKPKPMTLSKLQRSAEALAPHDAAVARCIRQESSSRSLRLELAGALPALVGHPALAFADAPEQLIALREAGPELEVHNAGQTLRVQMQPGLHSDDDTPYYASAAEQRDAEALRAITVLQDGPQRARLVRLTPAQQRVAQLLGPAGLEIPQQGAAQLQEVLRGLGTHFQIHADDVPAAEPAYELPPETRLRAELMPVGQALQLRLVAAPFGDAHAAEGPRLIPGRGRARIIATMGGQTLGVQRQLEREREHLENLLDLCPMLLPLPPDAPCEWTLDEPDEALALIEILRQHHAVMALDWPKGKSVRVDSAGLAAMSLNIKSHQDWLALQGELAVDEHLVLSLKQLIAFAGGSKSRFMPLGEGRYLALTQELRARLDDLAAVAETAKGADDGVRIPDLAAGWLDDALQGAQVQQDQASTERIYRLARARDLTPTLPATLQATLRPYQEEGYVWAMRLAEAGLGACLADDMGLGKTLQALAVLLARAVGGPALVVAPTSLIGNWQAEARRFAPSLNVHVYADSGAPRPSRAMATPRGGEPSLGRPGERLSERDNVLMQMGDHSLLLVSYQMLQQDAAAFADRTWHTLILDEAQAIKNAAAKRSQAVFDLKADFRMALSGTPIENRLAELWSIMRAVNPGLLGSQARFNERFAGLIERQRDRVAQRTLRRLINPFILRRTKAQVLDDLPPRTELVLTVEPDARERAHYEALRRDAVEASLKALTGNAAGQAHLNVLAQLTKLRRAACDPRLVSPGLGWAGAKVQAFGELAAELVANGHKTLVFSQFVDFLALLKEPLDAAGIAYQYLDGSTPAAERTKRVNAFQDGQGDLFLISLKAGGFGLNLTVADFVVIADPWWNPAAEDQASGRAHRIGQQRPVTVYRLVNQGTLEARILDLHKDKRELADSVLAGEEGLAGGAVPAPEELLRLMRGE
jgi:superfamily II DNA or RNA helicase